MSTSLYERLGGTPGIEAIAKDLVANHLANDTVKARYTSDPAEIAKFEAMAAEWWDPNGKFKPLHMLNPCRLDYITTQIAAAFDRDLTARDPLKGLRILDIGCGGGLLSEPMARLGATVVGADAAERNIPVARLHAEQSGLDIDYRHTTAEAMAEAGEQFDVVLNMEVVEHVADPLAYMTACQQLLKPGGLMICSTLNRNAKSFAMAIVGAEWVMRWLPKGTHDWAKFITPEELYDLIRRAGPGAKQGAQPVALIMDIIIRSDQNRIGKGPQGGNELGVGTQILCFADLQPRAFQRAHRPGQAAQVVGGKPQDDAIGAHRWGQQAAQGKVERGKSRRIRGQRHDQRRLLPMRALWQQGPQPPAQIGDRTA